VKSVQGVGGKSCGKFTVEEEIGLRTFKHVTVIPGV
jgi:hypothetical protein